MILQRLNANGLIQFRSYLGCLRESPTTPPPTELLADPRFTERLSRQLSVERRDFVNKYDAGVYLNQLLAPLSSDQVRVDGGLWSWLAIFFFDQLCPAKTGGSRKPLAENSRYLARVGEHRAVEGDPRGGHCVDLSPASRR